MRLSELFIAALLLLAPYFQVLRSQTNKTTTSVVEISTENTNEGDKNEEGKHCDRKSFDEFIEKFNKNYADEDEYEYRFIVFCANMEKATSIQRSDRGTAKFHVTMFSDFTEQEFRKIRGLKRPRGLKYYSRLPLAVIPNVDLVDYFDWRDYNAVTDVKDQGRCNSCWVFSAIGNIESIWAVKHGELLSLSEQQVVDCALFGRGCREGYITSAYEALIKIGGVETDEDYPYQGKIGKCLYNESKSVVQISGAVAISGDEDSMAKWLFKNGPIAAAMNSENLLNYGGGVYHPSREECGYAVDHAVLLVGFGVEDTPDTDQPIPYWIIKNSWGTDWGEDGYLRLSRGFGTCGINLMAYSVVL